MSKFGCMKVPKPTHTDLCSTQPQPCSKLKIKDPKGQKKGQRDLEGAISKLEYEWIGGGLIFI